MTIERRGEKRYPITDPIQQRIQLTVKNGSERVPAVIGNFSRHGILFECPWRLDKGARAECVLRADTKVAREITFGIEVKYCYENKGSFIVGASIDAISDDRWFDAFERLFDLIAVRLGKK